MASVATTATAQQRATTGPAAPAKKARKRKETRTADGDGCLYFDAKRALWVAELMVGWKPRANDPRRRVRDIRRRTAKTQMAARVKLQELREQHVKGTMPEKSAADTVAHFVERWLKAKQGTVRERTHTRYGQLLHKHITPVIGKRRLPALKPDALQGLYAEKLAIGLAPRTVHHIHTVLHGVLEDAVKWGYVGTNVADRVDAPQVPDTEKRWLSAEQVGRLLAESQAHADRLSALWVLAAHTGMRLGELLGLQWGDVDLDAGVLEIRRTLVKVVAQVPTFGEPKTKRSQRMVPLTPMAVAALREHYDRQQFERKPLGDDYGQYGLVFATLLGTPISNTVALQYFRRALGWANLPTKTRIHDLRHAAASTMLGNGVDVATVARVLGHARNSTTLDVYGHAVPANLTKAVAALQQAIHGA